MHFRDDGSPEHNYAPAIGAGEGQSNRWVDQPGLKGVLLDGRRSQPLAEGEGQWWGEGRGGGRGQGRGGGGGARGGGGGKGLNERACFEIISFKIITFLILVETNSKCDEIYSTVKTGKTQSCGN